MCGIDHRLDPNTSATSGAAKSSRSQCDAEASNFGGTKHYKYNILKSCYTIILYSLCECGDLLIHLTRCYLGLPSALCFLVLSLGQCRVNAKVRKENDRASKTHANDSSNQIARTAVDLVDLEVALGVAHTTLRRSVCGIGADSKGTYKVDSVWYKLSRLPLNSVGCQGQISLHCEAAKLVQLQQHHSYVGVGHLDRRKCTAGWENATQAKQVLSSCSAVLARARHASPQAVLPQ